MAGQVIRARARSTRGLEVPTKFRDADIVIADSVPAMSGDMWIGVWSFDSELELTITLEREYVERLKHHAATSPAAMKVATAILIRTLEHEHDEATMTLERAFEALAKKGLSRQQTRQYARQNFVGFKCVSWFEQLAGEIHFELEPEGGSAYRQSMKDLATLGYQL